MTEVNILNWMNAMIARVATFSPLPDGLDEAPVDLLRETIRETPGYVAGFHLRDPETQKALSVTIFEDMKSVSGIPLIDAEHRAMATSPDWLETWWRDCKPIYADPRRRQLCAQLLEQGRSAAAELPYRLALSADLLDAAGVHQTERDLIVQTATAYCDMLPGLTVDMAIARKGLGDREQSS